MDEHTSSSVDDGWVELLDALPSSPPTPQNTPAEAIARPAPRAPIVGPPPKMTSVPERPKAAPAWAIPLPRPGQVSTPPLEPANDIPIAASPEPTPPAEDVPIGQADAITVPEPLHAANDHEPQAAQSGEIEVEDEPAANSKPRTVLDPDADSDDDLEFASHSRESLTIPGFAAAYRNEEDLEDDVVVRRRPTRVAAMFGGLAIALTVVGVSTMDSSPADSATPTVAAASLPSVGSNPTPEPQRPAAEPPAEPAPTPAEAPASDASPAQALLDTARTQLQSGDAAAAYVSARDSHRVERSVDALLVMGKAACEMRSRHKVEFVLRMLRPADRRSITALCQRKGLVLDAAPTTSESESAVDIIE